jgi:hypothetical protein
VPRRWPMPWSHVLMPFPPTQHSCLPPTPSNLLYILAQFIRLSPDIAFMALHIAQLHLYLSYIPLFVSFGSPRINTCTCHAILNPQLRFLSHILLFYPSFLLLYCSISCIIYLSCGRIVSTSMDRICFPPFRRSL